MRICWLPNSSQRTVSCTAAAAKVARRRSSSLPRSSSLRSSGSLTCNCTSGSTSARRLRLRSGFSQVLQKVKAWHKLAKPEGRRFAHGSSLKKWSAKLT